MKKLTSILIAFSLSLLFSIRAFAIDDIDSYLRIGDWKSYEAKGGVYKNAFNKSSYRFITKLSEENIKGTDRIIKKFIDEHTEFPYYVIVFDEYHSPNEIRIYYSDQPFVYCFSDYYGVIMSQTETTIHYYNYEVGRGKEYYLDDIKLKPTQHDIDNYHGWADYSIGHYALDSSVPTYLVDELYAIEEGANPENYTVGSDKSHIYNYDNFDFLTDLRFTRSYDESATNHLSLPSVDCGFVTNSLSILNTMSQDKQKAKFYITYGMDLYQQSHTSEFIVNCTLRGINDDSDEIFFTGQSNFDADGVSLLDIPPGSMGYKPTGKKKFGYYEVDPMTYRGSGRFVIQADIWLTDFEGNSSGHFTKNFNFDYMTLIDTEVTDSSITTNNNPFESTNGNNIINPPNPDNPIEDSPDYNVQASSGVTVNNNNNVNFPSDINVHVDGVGGGGGSSDDFNFNFGDLGGEAPEGIKDGLGWFDGNNGFLSFLLAFYGNIDPKAKVLITFGIVTTITIAIIRMVFKR